MNSLAYSNNNSRTLTFPKEVLSFCKENDLIHNNSLSISVTTLRQAGIISDNNIKMGDLNQSEDLSQVIDGANTIGNTESFTVTPPINSHDPSTENRTEKLSYISKRFEVSRRRLIISGMPAFSVIKHFNIIKN